MPSPSTSPVATAEPAHSIKRQVRIPDANKLAMHRLLVYLILEESKVSPTQPAKRDELRVAIAVHVVRGGVVVCLRLIWIIAQRAGSDEAVPLYVCSAAKSSPRGVPPTTSTALSLS